MGEKEENAETVSVRRQGEGDKGTMKMKEFADFLNKEVENQLSSIEEKV